MGIPRTSSNFAMNLVSCVLFFATTHFLWNVLPQSNSIQKVLTGLLIAAVPLWIYDLSVLRVQERESTGLNKTAGRSDGNRLITKLIGLYGTFLIILMLYKINPVYYVTDNAVRFYGAFFSVIVSGIPWILSGSFIYFWLVDRLQKDPYDEYWQAGCLLTGRFKKVNRVVLIEYAKAWFIKAFFAPFMFGLLVDYVQTIGQSRLSGATFLGLYNHSLDLFYAVDIFFGVLGYVLALRILDTHIQSTEPTAVGWWSCLACYSPFYAVIGIGLLPSQSESSWEFWLASNPVLFYGCGIMIIILSLVYALATVAIGYRMSNLTYRGIITSGPYRFTKHPAYLCKVASWWLVSMPFLSSQGGSFLILQCLSMIAITLVYYIRAKTEEDHLSNYPEYVNYANWINDHGLFAFLGKAFPVIRYSEERARKSKSVVWFKKLKTQA